ncbi:MAG TPA: helix-hairpin-helix domain-containing protein [Desulfuromonadaceae bacterium]
MKNRRVIPLLSLMALLCAAPFSPAAAITAPAPVPAAAARGSVPKVLVDINSATRAELKAIPGLGDSLAARIVANRPYANKVQLRSRKIIPKAVYEKIRDLIIARQPKKK